MRLAQFSTVMRLEPFSAVQVHGLSRSNLSAAKAPSAHAHAPGTAAAAGGGGVEPSPKEDGVGGGGEPAAKARKPRSLSKAEAEAARAAEIARVKGEIAAEQAAAEVHAPTPLAFTNL